MVSDIKQALQQAVSVHKEGKLQDAKSIYQAILLTHPLQPDANHNLGIIAVSSNKFSDALPLFETALKSDPKIEQFWLSYIDILIKLNRKIEARNVFYNAKKRGFKSLALDQYDQQLKQIESTPKINLETQNLTQDHLTLLMKLYDQGQMQKAFNEVSQLIQKFPSSATLFNISGTINKRLGKHDKAIIDYNKALALDPNYADAFNNLGATLYDMGKLEDAVKLYNTALIIKPHFAEAHYNMGKALKNLGRIDQAIKAYENATIARPDYFDAFNNLGNIFLEQQKYQASLEAYKKALTINSRSSKAYNNIGNIFKKLNKHDQAIKAFKKAVAIRPEYAEAYYNMGIAQHNKGILDEAEAAYVKAVTINPMYAEAYYNMGIVLNKNRRLDEAEIAFKKAIAIRPEDANAHNNMGDNLQARGKLDAALKAFKKAIAISPKYADAYNNMGNCLQAQGRLTEAITAYNDAISIKPDYADAHRNLSTIKKYRSEDDQFIQVKSLYNSGTLSEDAKCNLSFVLAKAYHDLGHLYNAFMYLTVGNDLRKKILDYNISKDQVLFSKLKKSQAHIRRNAINPTINSNDIIPVFILGMPRSGTTLVEQIICSHSEVTGAGELPYVSIFGTKMAEGMSIPTAEKIKAFRRNYLLELTKMSENRRFVTDKMPQNFRFIPLICAALPEAKIIHVKRDAKATFWSTYRHYFATKDLGYCYNLDDIIAYYELYIDLMQFWQSDYGNKIYHLNYEKLTENQETETRYLIKHLDLEWDDKCLEPEKNKRNANTASQQQVRQKVYQGSSLAWRTYEHFLIDNFSKYES